MNIQVGYNIFKIYLLTKVSIEDVVCLIFDMSTIVAFGVYTNLCNGYISLYVISIQGKVAELNSS